MNLFPNITQPVIYVNRLAISLGAESPKRVTGGTIY
jgi:hypothetical protein